MKQKNIGIISSCEDQELQTHDHGTAYIYANTEWCVHLPIQTTWQKKQVVDYASTLFLSNYDQTHNMMWSHVGDDRILETTCELFHLVD